MDINHLSTYEVGKLARALVASRLKLLGFNPKILNGNKSIVLVESKTDYRALTIRVKSRRSGDWQIPITEGRSINEYVDDNEIWILVDLQSKETDPDFYIIPGKILRRDIYNDHQKYLFSHGGKRPVTPKSTHHKVTLESIQNWKDSWNLFE